MAKAYLQLQPWLRRFKMIPKLGRITMSSLRKGEWVNCRVPGRYAKYGGHFAEVMAKRDLAKGTSLTEEEFYTLYAGLRAVQAVDGAVAEVGVHRGGSAKVLCEVKGDKPLFLCDTFGGMPDEKIADDKDRWERGTHTDTSEQAVRTYLSEYDNVHFVPGIFPESVAAHPELALEDETFCFVHLDVDLYQSTLDALAFFYPRMAPNGRIVSHNYNLSGVVGGDTPGVRTAFLEYFKGEEHRVVEIAETQCLVIKT